MSLLVFEPDLSSFAGHYNRDIRVLGMEARRRGVSLAVVTHKNIQFELRSSLEALGVSVLPLFESAPRRFPASMNEIRAFQRTMADTAIACFRDRRGSRPVWPSGRGVTLAAASLFALEARLPFVTRMLDFSLDWPSGALSAPAWLRDDVVRACDAGMRLYAETPFIARQVAEEIGVPVSASSAVLELAPLHERGRGSRPVVGFMNLLRGSKNRELALSALVEHADMISLVLHMGQGTRTGSRRSIRRFVEDVLVQTRLKPEVVGRTLPTFQSYLERLVQRHRRLSPDIRIVPGILTATEYDGIWSGLDCSIMPYDIERYARQGSGILFECLSDGIIPIAPDGTAMAITMNEAGVGVTYNAKNPSGLSHAISHMCAEFDTLLARSIAYAPHYRSVNAPTHILDTYLHPD